MKDIGSMTDAELVEAALKARKLDHRILTRACGLCWHEWKQDLGEASVSCIHCGVELLPETKVNPTFVTADDWELVRVRVVVPHLVEFCLYLGDYVGSPPYGYYALSLEWILYQEPVYMIEKCLSFIKARPDLFPWVEMMEE